MEYLPQNLVRDHLNRSGVVLQQDMTVDQALQAIRRNAQVQVLTYFYIVDKEGRLQGVVPARSLLISQPQQLITEICLPNVVSLSEESTIMEACEYFALYKFLAFPVVDVQGRYLGVVDIRLFTEEVMDFTEREHLDEVFESIGLRVSAEARHTVLQSFKARFPWLLTTVVSGILCAILTGIFQVTLAQSILLAFFLTLVLGLGESMAVQSLTMALQSLRTGAPSLRSLGRILRKEMPVALLLGIVIGSIVMVIQQLWMGDLPAGLVIGASITLSMVNASVWGASIPYLLHSLRWEPRIAAGPLALAMTDLGTIAIYLSMATLVLRKTQ